jgi:agmatine/peptidylarginine deiminase
MKQVYILTEEGRAFSEEGLEFIKQMILDKCQDTSELLFSMGQAYNRPKHLITELKLHPDSYLAFSIRESQSVFILYGEENTKAAIERLENAKPDEISYNILMKDLTEAGIIK